MRKHACPEAHSELREPGQGGEGEVRARLRPGELGRRVWALFFPLACVWRGSRPKGRQGRNVPERRQERSLGVEARERRGLVTTCSPAGSSANSSSCRPRRRRKPLPRAQERGRGCEQTGPSWAPGPAGLFPTPRPKGSLPWGDSPPWSHTNHLSCQSYAGLGSTRNKNEHKTRPLPFPGPSLCGRVGRGALGERLLPATGEPGAQEERPPAAAAGALPVPEWPESDTAGRAERSRLRMLSSGQAPRWAPVSHRGSNPPGRYLPGWGRSILLRLTH